MGWTQPSHIVIILVIALLLFGGKRLPEIGRSLGHGMREFKDAVSGTTPTPSEQTEAQAQLPPAEPTVTATTATPSEHEPS